MRSYGINKHKGKTLWELEHEVQCAIRHLDEVIGTHHLTEVELSELRAMRSSMHGNLQYVKKAIAGRSAASSRENTLSEVGDVFGVTRERVRQIEASAFKKLMTPEVGRMLRPYLDDMGAINPERR